MPLPQCHSLSVLQCLTLCSTITILQISFSWLLQLYRLLLGFLRSTIPSDHRQKGLRNPGTVVSVVWHLHPTWLSHSFMDGDGYHLSSSKKQAGTMGLWDFISKYKARSLVICSHSHTAPYHKSCHKLEVELYSIQVNTLTYLRRVIHFKHFGRPP